MPAAGDSARHEEESVRFPAAFVCGLRIGNESQLVFYYILGIGRKGVEFFGVMQF